MTFPRKSLVRSFSLLDLMIIVAAIALWLVVTRSYAQAIRSDLSSIWSLAELGIVRIFANQGSYLLICSSFTMLLIRLRGPRPPRRRLWRQPGLAASAGAVVGILAGTAGVLSNWASSPEPSIEVLQILQGVRPFAAPGVFGAWIALAFTRRWRSERGAIDRLGRLVGLLWLVEFVVAEMPTTRWVAILDHLSRQGFQ